jgi:hypothetical protein
VGGSSAVARSANAAATVGQDTPRSRAAWVIVRPSTATASPAAARNLPVSRARGGSCGAATQATAAGTAFGSDTP